MQIKMWTLISILALAIPLFGQETIRVTVEGYGRSPRDAERDALRAAVEKAVGSFVDAEVLVANEQVIHDKVLTYSDGLVQQILEKSEPVKEGPLYKVTLTALVEKAKVSQKLQEAQVISAAVDGVDLWAQSVSRIQNVNDGRLLLQKFFDDNPLSSLLVARLIDPQGRTGSDAEPVVNVNYDDPTKTTVTIYVEVYFNLEAYYTQYAPKLVKLLDQIAEVKTESFPLSYKVNAHDRFSSLASGTNAFGKQHARIARRDDFERNYGEDKEKFRHGNLQVNIGRDQLGLSQRFKCYQIDDKAYGAILEAQDIGRLGVNDHGKWPELYITFKGDENQIIWQSRLKDFQDGLHSPEKGYQAGGDIRFMLFARSPWFAGRTISPEICVDTNAYNQAYFDYILSRDAVTQRFTFTMHPDDVKDMKRVELSFKK